MEEDRVRTLMDKKQFVEGTLSDTISEACSWVDHLEYEGSRSFEYVIIVCENGHTYKVNVFADSKSAIISDVIKEVSKH